MIHGTYEVVLGFLVFLSVVTFVGGLWYTNPYGRFAPDKAGFSLREPWSWLLFECPQWWAFTVTYWFMTPGRGAPAVVLYSLWQAHYLYRGFVYPLTRNRSGKPFPISGIAFGFMFNALNGFVNGYAVGHVAHLQSSDWFRDPRFAIGLVIAVVGWIVNFRADRVLINLRSDGSTGYRIPFGGAFRWVSSANYLGELVLWGGWAIMAWTLPGLVFFIFSIANLVPRALATHRWYRKTFGADYPAARRAIVPGLL